MKREIYIVRHGETDYNLQGIVQGRGVNSSLNQTGRKQAESFYHAYKGVDFDMVYTSTLKRTHQTVDCFLTGTQPHMKLPSLDEIDWGIYEGIAHDPVMHERYLSIIEQWKNNELHIRIDGGESAFDLWNRITPFVTRLRTDNYTKSLVCSHGRSIRVLLCAMTGKPLNLMDEFPHTNTSLYKLLFDGEHFEIELFNNTEHLNGKL